MDVPWKQLSESWIQKAPQYVSHLHKISRIHKPTETGSRPVGAGNGGNGEWPLMNTGFYYGGNDYCKTGY